MNDIDQYLNFTHQTAKYPGVGTTLEGMYLALGLTGEAGEVAEKMKKLHRDGVLDKERTAKELGDVFWYLVRLCNWLGYQPSEIIEMNTEKLAKRLLDGTIKGNGDDR